MNAKSYDNANIILILAVMTAYFIMFIVFIDGSVSKHFEELKVLIQQEKISETSQL